MSELFKIVLTASITLIGGVILLVVTQVFTKFVVDPLVDLRRLLGKTSYTLAFYANFFYNASATAGNPHFQKATHACRDLASEVLGFSAAVPLYSFLVRLRLIPPLTNVRDASRELVGLSNITASTPASHVDHHYKRIGELLKIRVS